MVIFSVFFLFTLVLVEKHGSRRLDTTLGASSSGAGLKREEKRFAVAAVSGLVIERHSEPCEREGSSV